MRKNLSLLVCLSLIFVPISLKAFSPLEEPENVNGLWQLSVEYIRREVVWDVVFFQRGEKLYVTMKRKDIRPRLLKGQGQIRGNEIEWSITTTPAPPTTIIYKGKIFGTSMWGELSINGTSTADWWASKKMGPSAIGHNAGLDCLLCHSYFKVAGTVFKDSSATEVMPGVPVSLISPEGNEIILDESDENGNISSTLVPEGKYLVQVGEVSSRTWHELPAQASCNECHIVGGNSSRTRTKTLPAHHTTIPEDNNCRHCHHFPATMAYYELKTPGVLNAAAQPPSPPGSQVEIAGQIYNFDPSEYKITTVRPDIFAPGYFSMFDVILAVAKKNGLPIEYHFDESCQTHFITKINNKPGDYWYRFSYDAGQGNRNELKNRRAYRWDEALWKPGVWIKVVKGENLAEIKREYREEIMRERTFGHVIPYVKIDINPSSYKGNPPESHRITVTREFYNVKVTPHNLRSLGYPSPYPKPFQPGVVTSLDILLSLKDQGKLDLVTSVFYTYFAQKYIHSYYVVALGFPGVGVAHASGRQGFVYVTNNGTFNRLPNNADRKFHMTCDICVIHAPDFSYWRWIELGDPYYETSEPSKAAQAKGGFLTNRFSFPEHESQLLKSIQEDFKALDRGFNLHKPRQDPKDGALIISFNIFYPGKTNISLYDLEGRKIETLFNKEVKNIGVHKIKWHPESPLEGIYFVAMKYENHTQFRRVLIKGSS